MSPASDLRARFALAIAAALVPACKSASTDATPGVDPTTTVDLVPTGTPTSPGTSVATSTRPPSGEPAPPKSSDKVLRESLGGGYWSLEPVRDTPPDVRPGMHMASCPNASYCVRAPASPPGAAAPSPYEMCAATASPPKQPEGQIEFSASLTREERALEPTACCYRWYILCPGGRPLHGDRGESIVASAISRSDWAAAATRAAEEPSPAVRALLAEHWAREAVFEHASVASFSLTSLELASLGAPADLLEGAHRAALDEIEHAKLCFELAARHGGAPLGPGALPLGAVSVSTDAPDVARKTLRDACLNETVASLVASAAASGATDERARAALETIASDEARHAELGWRTLAWLVRTFDVRDALSGELAALRTTEPSARNTSPNALAATLRRHGVVSAEEQAELRVSAVREVVVPCLEALLAASPSRPSSARGPSLES